MLRFPSQIRNLALAEKVFAEGREKGLVDIHAIASVDDKVAATVWFPKFIGEKIQGWNSGMKLSIAHRCQAQNLSAGLDGFASVCSQSFDITNVAS